MRVKNLAGERISVYLAPRTAEGIEANTGEKGRQPILCRDLCRAPSGGKSALSRVFHDDRPTAGNPDIADESAGCYGARPKYRVPHGCGHCFQLQRVIPGVEEAAATELASLLGSGLSPEHAALFLNALAADRAGAGPVLELVTSGPDASGLIRETGVVLSCSLRPSTGYWLSTLLSTRPRDLRWPRHSHGGAPRPRRPPLPAG
jgi:hypothetical protein